MLEQIKKFFMDNKFLAEIRLLSTALVLVITLLVFFGINGSLGWFSSNDQVTADGMNVSVRDIKDFTVSIKSYAVDGISRSNYSFSSQTEAYALPTLDPSGIVYSQYERALVVELKIKAIQEATASLSLKTTHPSPSYAQSNYISNCIEVFPATLSGSEPFVAVNGGSAQSFITVSGGAVNKTSSITLLNDIHLEEGDEITLYFILEYNETAIQALFNGARAEGNDNIHEMSFTNDVAFVVERAD